MRLLVSGIRLVGKIWGRLPFLPSYAGGDVVAERTLVVALALIVVWATYSYRRSVDPEALQQDCDAGEMEACFSLGNMYKSANTIGEMENPEYDSARAISLWTQACDGGYVEACFDLGFRYQLGVGVPQDTARGTSLRQQACKLLLTPNGARGPGGLLSGVEMECEGEEVMGVRARE